MSVSVNIYLNVPHNAMVKIYIVAGDWDQTIYADELVSIKRDQRRNHDT